MLSNHLILCCPLLLLPSIFPSIRVFSNELALHVRWPKYWSFSFSPSNEYSGLISFRIDWFNLLTLESSRDSQESSPAPHSKSTDSLALSLFQVLTARILELACHPPLQWAIFCQTAPLWPVCLGWSCRTWLIASLSYASPIATTRLWSMKGLFKYFFIKKNQTGLSFSLLSYGNSLYILDY